MKLHNIPAIPMMSKQVITDLDSSKVSSPGHTSVVFLMNFDSKRSYVLLIFSTLIRNLVFYGWKVLGRGL